MTTTIILCITFYLPEERQAAEEFWHKHSQYGWRKVQSTDGEKIYFKYEQSQVIGGDST